MKFIIDQQLPPALTTWLQRKGHDASHVRDHGLREAEDEDIWDFALRHRAIVVTKDADFSDRRARVSAGPTILWLRIGNTTTPELFALLEHAWLTVELDLASEPIVEVR